jgi:protein involved in polysaccharide export with SLBB domain
MFESKTFRVCLGAAFLMCAVFGGDTTTAEQNPQPLAASDYRIGPEDTLQITVSKHPDLSVDAVRPDGYIRLPIFHEEQALGLGTNDVRVMGLTQDDELGRVLSRKIGHRTTAVVKEAKSKRLIETEPHEFRTPLGTFT